MIYYKKEKIIINYFKIELTNAYKGTNSGHAFKIFNNNSCCFRSSDGSITVINFDKILLYIRIFLFLLSDDFAVAVYQPASWKQTPIPGLQQIYNKNSCITSGTVRGFLIFSSSSFIYSLNSDL